MRMCICFLVYVFVAQFAAADESPSHQVYAKPVVRTAPTYPGIELRNGRQGWVDLSFVVTEEGKVIDPVVEASSGSRAFERAAINTVKRWRYEPALLNGEPIQQCKNAVRITFAVDGSRTGVSRRFRNKYRKMDKALDQGDVEFADSELEKTLQSNGLTLGELSWLWTMQARIAEQRGDRERQLIAVRRALAVPERGIPIRLRKDLLTTRAILELENGNYADAMDAYAGLREIDGADTSKLDPIAEEIRAFADSDRLLFKAAEIGAEESCETCNARWRYKPLRRAIEIADIEGKLENLEIRCDWQRFVDQAREGVAWRIPDSWGECSVVVYGKPGSTFKLVELPASS